MDLRIEDLLAEGLDDWVSLHNVVWHARELADGDEAEVPGLVRQVLTAIIGGGLMAPGNLGEPGHIGLDLWAGEPEELIERVMAECEQLGWNPRGEGCWFANTAEGDRRARDDEGGNDG